MEQKPDLKRPKTKKRVTSIHDQDSEMHRAISMRDKNWVTTLLLNGDKLCNGVDTRDLRHALPNCFFWAQSVGTWPFMKFLLTLDPAAGVTAKNFDGLTLLMLYAKEHDVRAVQYLLELGADSNALSNDGTTALMFALSKFYPLSLYDENQMTYSLFVKRRQSFREKCQSIVDLLLQNGADIDVCNKRKENALHIAAKNRYSFQLDLIKSLIDAGIDPTVEDILHWSVLKCALKMFVDLCIQCVNTENCALALELYPTLHYLFNLPPFHLDTFQIHRSAGWNPQTHLLAYLSLCQMLTDNKSIFVELISTNKNLVNREFIVHNCFCYLDNDNNDNRLDMDVVLPFGPIAHYLNHEFLSDSAPITFKARYGENLLENVDYLMSLGYTVNVPTQETISPLTVAFLHDYPYFSYRYVILARNLERRGVPVEQRMLKFVEVDAELEQLSEDLCLPDAIRVFLSQSHIQPEVTLELMMLLLHRFAHPPLTLLPFVSPEKVDTLFPFLACYGHAHLQHFAPHTTAKRRILKSVRLSEEDLQTFNEMNKSIPRLQEMCRTVVRARLAQRACQTGNSLPGLIESFPPLALGPRKILVNVGHFLGFKY